MPEIIFLLLKIYVIIGLVWALTMGVADWKYDPDNDWVPRLFLVAATFCIWPVVNFIIIKLWWRDTYGS